MPSSEDVVGVHFQVKQLNDLMLYLIFYHPAAKVTSISDTFF